MQPLLVTIQEKKLIGKSLSMTFAENRTPELWRSFMPHRKEIQHAVSTDLFSMQIYPSSFSFNAFNPLVAFDKWAAVEVADFDAIPDGMQPFTLAGGLYAVFHYKGLSTDTQIFQYIFGEWLPQSAYVVDDRPHFEILGAKYKNNDPDSEEDIWVPIKYKQ